MAVETPSPGRPRNADIDVAVLTAARKQLANVGYESMSLMAIAEEAGTTRQALYRRWPTKADLATAAIASMSEIDERPDTEDPFSDLVAELKSFRDGVTRRNGISLVGTMLQESVDPELRDLFRERLVAPRRRRLAHILRRAEGAGLLGPEPDIVYGAAAATGILYSLALSGAPIPAAWPKRTAGFVWRACGGVQPSG
ncbi:MAG: TetR/AcrR family transcriptional regulator [Acidimicrobiales bacterium]